MIRDFRHSAPVVIRDVDFFLPRFAGTEADLRRGDAHVARKIANDFVGELVGEQARPFPIALKALADDLLRNENVEVKERLLKVEMEQKSGTEIILSKIGSMDESMKQMFIRIDQQSNKKTIMAVALTALMTGLIGALLLKIFN